MMINKNHLDTVVLSASANNGDALTRSQEITGGRSHAIEENAMRSHQVNGLKAVGVLDLDQESFLRVSALGKIRKGNVSGAVGLDQDDLIIGVNGFNTSDVANADMVAVGWNVVITSAVLALLMASAWASGTG